MPRIDPQLGPQMNVLLEKHRATPEITFEQHLAALEDEVAAQASEKTLVYLDLKYWIYLRDAHLGKPLRPAHTKLLELLLRGVADEKIICPITEAVFFEIERQGDVERRMNSVRMIDTLCKGVVIKPCHERIKFELADFFEAAIHRRSLLTTPCQRVWVRPYSFLGTPQLRGWGPAEDLAINKAFLSYMWSRSLEDLLTDTPIPKDESDSRFRETAKSITESSAQHTSSMKSFDQVYSDEIGGLIDCYRKEISRAFQPYGTTMFQGVKCDPSWF